MLLTYLGYMLGHTLTYLKIQARIGLRKYT